MNTEVWALAGVVVGAILGGGAQILNEAIRYRHERRDRLRVTREQAYVDLLNLCDQLQHGLIRLAKVHQQPYLDPGAQEDRFLRESEAVVSTAGEVQRQRQRVRIYGSRQARSRADALVPLLEQLLSALPPNEFRDSVVLGAAAGVGVVRELLVDDIRREVGARG